MSRQPEKPSFSASVLDLSERAQQAIGHTKSGGRLVKALAGSESLMYRQMYWRSQNMQAEVSKTVTVPGDPQAGRLARNWRMSAVLATPEDVLMDTKRGIDDEPYLEAVAYVSDEVVHVGTKAVESYLFAGTNETERAVAMRIGKGPLEATMGLWLPEQRLFKGLEEVRLLDTVAVDHLPQEYPGVLLT